MKKIYITVISALIIPLIMFVGCAKQEMVESDRVLIKTNMGEIEIKLNPEKAPISVENFKAYVRADYYNNTIFHRIVKGGMNIIQAGGLSLEGNPKQPILPPIKLEANNGLSNKMATIAYGRTNDPNSATGHFYINFKANTALDDRPGFTGYAVFGDVVRGNDIAEKIGNLNTVANSQRPAQNVIIESATIIMVPPK